MSANPAQNHPRLVRATEQPHAAAVHEPRDAASGAIKLSILMPTFNEEATLRAAVASVLDQDYPVEIELCVVDDGSTDGTAQILRQIDDPRVRVHRQPRNLGKGAAIVAAARMSSGTHIVPFDADQEYVAADLPRMLAPIIAGRCEVVFGTRMLGMNTRFQSYQHAMRNRVLTWTANLLFNSYLSDMHTCLKMMPRELFVGLPLRQQGFAMDSELTARLLQLGVRPFEVPISYFSRSTAEGKKVTWRDAVESLLLLVQIKLRRDTRGVLRRGAEGACQRGEMPR